MILRQHGGPQIELAILNYQFRDGADNWHDLNWLSVQVAVKSLGAHWKNVEPCLLTTEVRALAAWLRAAAVGRTDGPLDFVEPELSFAVVRPVEIGAPIPVGVTLRHGLLKNQSLVSGTFAEVPLVLHVAPDDLQLAASDLDAEAQRFPIRQGLP